MVEDRKGLEHVRASHHPRSLCPYSHHKELRLSGPDRDPWSCKGMLPNPHPLSLPTFLVPDLGEGLASWGGTSPAGCLRLGLITK